jgi:putative aldouronate transport system substrate-binding protein
MFNSSKIKIISMMLVVVFIIAGCGGTKSTETNSSAPTTAPTESTIVTTTQAPTEQLKVELPFVKLKWYLPPPIAEEKDKDAVMAEVNKMLKEKINAELEFVFLDWANYQQKIKLMAASNEEFDLMFMSGGYMSDNIRSNALAPMDDLLNKYGQNILKLENPEYMKAVTFNKQIYGVPNISPYSLQKGLSFKQDLVDKYKFDYKSVKTAKDLEPFLETIKKNEPGITPFLSIYDPLLDIRAAETFVKSIIYNFDDGSLVKLTDDKLTMDHYRLLNDWYKKGYIAKDAGTKKDISVETKSGKYAVMIADGNYDETNVKQSTSYGYPVVNIPWQGPTVITSNSIQSPATGISVTSKNPERAMMLLDLLFSDKKLYNTMAYGLEGKNYTVVSGQGTDNPTIETSKEATWTIWHNWIGDLVDNQWPSNWNNQKALDEFKANNAKGKVSPLLGFVFDQTPVKNEMTQISAITQEAFVDVLPTGMEPDFEKYWKETSDKLEKAGLSKVMDELKKQMDAWKATQ